MLGLAEIGVLTKNLARKIKRNNVPLMKYTDEKLVPKTHGPKSVKTLFQTPDFLIKPCKATNKDTGTNVQELEDSDNNPIFSELGFKRISPEFFDLLRKHQGIKIPSKFKKVKRSDSVCVEETSNEDSLASNHPNLAAHMEETMKNAPLSNFIYKINFYGKSTKRRTFKQSHLDLNYIHYLMDLLRANVRSLSADEIDDIKWYLSNTNGIEPAILADILRTLNSRYPEDPYFEQYLNTVLERLRFMSMQYFGFIKKPQYGDIKNKYGFPSPRKSITDIRRKINFAETPASMNHLTKRSDYPFKPVLFHEPFARDRMETWRADKISDRNVLDSFTEKQIDLGHSRSYLLDFSQYDKRPSYGGALQSRASVAYDPSLLSYRHSISPEHKTVSQFLLRYSDSPYGSNKRSYSKLQINT